MLDLGVLVSGSGTNLQAIFDAIAERRLDARVRLVVSNKAGVRALERAEQAGVPARVLSHRDHASREAFDAALVDALRDAGATWVVLAGFMRLLTPVFLQAFPWRVVNIHPALLPAFPGVDAQQQAIDYGVKVTGCTVHLVDEGTDTGPILAQRPLLVRDGEDTNSLRARLLELEHETLVQALSDIATRGLHVKVPASGKRPRAILGPP
jgi:phosphoribosylglycinamide formyltransferase 1